MHVLRQTYLVFTFLRATAVDLRVYVEEGHKNFFG